ncbi:hypothetical protein N7478_003714 [Penicillium angulare]|uniref:uncharacterized protein n=1 Tax=Penicillium angulare TaxID=116970 RepID=UPI0025408392|nr:uncharacterized protein N7478_003714 [Penicillium angulare]KAJ5288028.1 hypothetical protein N7478_003714 [Penicillium angulare]
MPQNGQRNGAENSIRKKSSRTNSTTQTGDTGSVFLSNSHSELSPDYPQRDTHEVGTPLSVTSGSTTLSSESNGGNYRLGTIKRAAEIDFMKFTYPNWSIGVEGSRQEPSDCLVENLIFPGGNANQRASPKRTGKPPPQQILRPASDLRIDTRIGSRFYARRDDIEHVSSSPS